MFTQVGWQFPSALPLPYCLLTALFYSLSLSLFLRCLSLTQVFLPARKFPMVLISDRSHRRFDVLLRCILLCARRIFFNWPPLLLLLALVS